MKPNMRFKKKIFMLITKMVIMKFYLIIALLNIKCIIIIYICLVLKIKRNLLIIKQILQVKRTK